MAQLVAGFGSSHSTMLLSPVENWLALFDHVDQRAPIFDFDGKPRSFDELLANLPEDAPARLAPGVITSRFDDTQRAMAQLTLDLAAAQLDALIIVGDDQRELFKDAFRPAIGIYYGETIRNAAAPSPLPEDWYARDQCKRLEDGSDRHYPCHTALGLHLIEGLTARGFDITACAVKRQTKPRASTPCVAPAMSAPRDSRGWPARPAREIHTGTRNQLRGVARQTETAVPRGRVFARGSGSSWCRPGGPSPCSRARPSELRFLSVS